MQVACRASEPAKPCLGSGLRVPGGTNRSRSVQCRGTEVFHPCSELEAPSVQAAERHPPGPGLPLAHEMARADHGRRVVHRALLRYSGHPSTSMSRRRLPARVVRNGASTDPRPPRSGGSRRRGRARARIQRRGTGGPPSGSAPRSCSTGPPRPPGRCAGSPLPAGRAAPDARRGSGRSPIRGVPGRRAGTAGRPPRSARRARWA